MQRYSEVLGLPVICVEDGKKLGIVKDLVFCPKTREVKAFIVEQRGFELRPKVVFLNDVLSLGRDALIVNDCLCVKTLSRDEYERQFREKGEIKGLRIYSKSGEDLGVVKDVLFNYTTGSIEGVEISDGLLQDIVSGRNILPLFGRVEFSEENILVDREAVEEMENTGGGIRKKLLGDKT